MTNDHNHSHHHHHSSTTIKALTITLGLNALLLVAELVIGYISNSLVLLSDAAHMVSDVAALSLGLAAAYLASKPTSLNKSFGFSSAEVLSAFVNALVLIGACLFIGVKAVGRIMSGVSEVDGGPVLIIGIIGLAINLGSAWLLRKGSHNLNVRGVLLHMVADALGSAGAILAAILVMAGHSLADPVISIIIGIIILVNACLLVRDCTRVLLGFAPRNLDPAAIKIAIEKINGVVSTHDYHLWSQTGDYPLLTCHLKTDGSNKLLLKNITEMLIDKFGISHSTIQVEGAELACGCNCELGIK